MTHKYANFFNNGQRHHSLALFIDTISILEFQTKPLFIEVIPKPLKNAVYGL
jgi:hypothetical protein